MKRTKSYLIFLSLIILLVSTISNVSADVVTTQNGNHWTMYDNFTTFDTNYWNFIGGSTSHDGVNHRIETDTTSIGGIILNNSNFLTTAREEWNVTLWVEVSTMTNPKNMYFYSIFQSDTSEIFGGNYLYDERFQIQANQLKWLYHEKTGNNTNIIDKGIGGTYLTTTEKKFEFRKTINPSTNEFRVDHYIDDVLQLFSGDDFIEGNFETTEYPLEYMNFVYATKYMYEGREVYLNAIEISTFKREFTTTTINSPVTSPIIKTIGDTASIEFTAIDGDDSTIICNLYSGDIIVSTDNSVLNNTLTTLNYINNGTIENVTLSVECNDGVSFPDRSEGFVFEFTPPPPNKPLINTIITEIRDLTPTDISYYVSDNNSVTLDCDLYFSNEINLTELVNPVLSDSDTNIISGTFHDFLFDFSSYQTIETEQDIYLQLTCDNGISSTDSELYSIYTRPTFLYTDGDISKATVSIIGKIIITIGLFTTLLVLGIGFGGFRKILLSIL